MMAEDSSHCCILELCVFVSVCQFTCHEHCRQLITVQCPNTSAGFMRGRRPSRIQTETSLTEYAALWSVSKLQSFLKIVVYNVVLAVL